MGGKRVVFGLVLTLGVVPFIFFGCVESPLDDNLADAFYPQLPDGVFQPSSNLDVPPKNLLAKLFQKNGTPPVAVLNALEITSDEAAQYIWLSHYIEYKLEDVSASISSKYWNMSFFKIPTLPFYIGIKFPKNRYDEGVVGDEGVLGDEEKMIIIYGEEITRITEKLFDSSHDMATPAMSIYNNGLENFEDNLYSIHNNIYFHLPKGHPVGSICADDKDAIFALDDADFLLLWEEISKQPEANFCAIQTSLFFYKDYKREITFSYAYLYMTTSFQFSGWEEEEKFYIDNHKFASHLTEETHLSAASQHLLAELLFKIYYD